MDPQKAAADLHTLYLAYRSLLSTAAARVDGGLGGRFVLLTQRGPGKGLRALAARIAGAATLLVLESAQDAKASLQSGVCDFLVSNLDEALRILKNEIRRQAPITVGLRGSPLELLADCVGRGVQPDVIDAPHATLEDRGAHLLRWYAALQGNEHSVCWFVEGSLHMHAEADRMALDAIRTRAGERVRWLAESPSVLGRNWQRYRFLPMTGEELERFRKGTMSMPTKPVVVCDGQRVPN